MNRIARAHVPIAFDETGGAWVRLQPYVDRFVLALLRATRPLPNLAGKIIDFHISLLSDAQDTVYNARSISSPSKVEQRIGA